MKRRTFLLFFGLFLLLLLVGVMPILSQNNETIITLSIQEWQRDMYTASLFEDFEAANPGVKVVVVTPSSTNFYPASNDIEQHLDSVEALVATADVIAVQSWYMSVESTRAGYYLDLMPLIQQDPDFDQNDFFPSIWQAYQWDRGVWAIPTAANVEMFIYDANAFDEAGLAYPDANWTLDDLANAARTLSQTDASGNVTVPGFSTWDPLGIMRSIVGTGYYDDSVVPSEPRLNTPEIQAFIDSYVALLDEGVIQGFGEFDRNEVPLVVEGPWRIGGFGMTQDPDRNWKGSLFPGDGANLTVEALGISAGTTQPELSYELIKYLTNQPALAYRFGSTPVRRSLVGVEPEDGNFFRPEYPEEVQALLDQALETGYAYSEQRFGEYISTLLQRFPGQDEVTVELPTLEEQQQKALDNLEIAANRRGSSVVVVATPVPTPVIQAGEVVLRFRLEVPYSPLPNRERWDQLIEEFVAEDPTVGNIDLISGFGAQPDEEEPDCYYSTGTRVPTLDLSTALSFDPFMDADPDFDDSDFLTGAMNQVIRDNQTWAYPIAVSPFLLSYDTNLFEEAGVALPGESWTIDVFVDTLNQLKAADPTANYVFQSNDFGNTFIMMLTAAFGGLPIDYSTSPSTLNLTDPTVVNAIRQTLDLARNGLMYYTRLDSTSGGGGGGGQVPITSTSGASLAFSLGYRLSGEFTDFVDPTRYISYPKGTDYTPATYSLGAGYINASSQNPEGCYNLIKKIANTPDLVLGIPVRQSQLNDPALDNVVGEPVAQMFRDFAATFDDPNLVMMQDPNSFSGTFGTYIESIWLNQAFDAYVLDDADLETSLVDAQRYIEEYRACIPEDETPDLANMTTEEIQSFYEQFTECAVSIDPRLESRFNFGSDE